MKKNRLPFYLKPLQKVLEQSTDLTLSYLYDYSVQFYNEQLPYSEWLVSVKNFMCNNKEI